jgi:hypothetical protein
MIKNLKKKKPKIDTLKFMTTGDYCLKIINYVQIVQNLPRMAL